MALSRSSADATRPSGPAAPLPRANALRPARRRAAFLGALVALAAAGTAAAQTISIADDRGKTVVLSRPARRIVALAPHLAELALAAGAGSRLVGVARFSDYPPEARAIARIGDAARVDVERVLALAPDLVLAWRTGNQAADIERLERLGRSVLVTEPARLADVARLLRAIGAAAGTSGEAERAAAAFEREIAALAARYATAAPVRVFYAIWQQPLITVNGAHIISDVLRLCGGENVFARAPLLTPSVSLEALAAARPEAILGGSREGGQEAFAREWRSVPLPALAHLPAFYVDPDLVQRQTPRLLQGARRICAHLDTVRRARR